MSDLWVSNAKHLIEIPYNQESKRLEVVWDNSEGQTVLISQEFPDMSLDGSVSAIGGVLDCVYGVDDSFVLGRFTAMQLFLSDACIAWNWVGLQLHLQ